MQRATTTESRGVALCCSMGRGSQQYSKLNSEVVNVEVIADVTLVGEGEEIRTRPQVISLISPLD